MWNPPQLLAGCLINRRTVGVDPCTDSGCKSLSVKHNTDFFVHCLHHGARHCARTQNASHDLKIHRVLRDISVFRHQTARYSLIGGWRCGRHKISECWSFEATVYIGSRFIQLESRFWFRTELSGTNQQLYWTDLAECTHFLSRRNPRDTKRGGKPACQQTAHHRIASLSWLSCLEVVGSHDDMTRHVHNLLLRTRVPWKRLGCGPGNKVLRFMMFQGITSSPWDSLKPVFCRWQHIRCYQAAQWSLLRWQLVEGPSPHHTWRRFRGLLFDLCLRRTKAVCDSSFATFSQLTYCWI